MKKTIILFMHLTLLAGAENPIPFSRYTTYARECADWAWDHMDSLTAVWQKSLDPDNVFGYRPPPYLLETAAIYAEFAQHGEEAEIVRRAKHILTTYGDYRKAYPKESAQKRSDYTEGVPALPDFFTLMRYIRAYYHLSLKDVFLPEEASRIEKNIAQSISYLLRTQEWGAMNRAMLRAECLAWAIKAITSHPEIEVWKAAERSLIQDNWTQWQIEDATHYQAIWLYSLLGYADATGRMEELFRTPQMSYYARYLLQLMAPHGMIPDFGDSHWKSNWSRYLVFFEACAAAYQDPQYKWAANTIAKQHIAWEKKNLELAYILLDCVRFGGLSCSEKTPETKSLEVLEDVIGKKIVFRNGWESGATYMLLNYRDEGDGGSLFRDYLRDTIPVEEEKMTHGHSDENSLVMLMSGGSLLLHDGGYRDYMPSGPYGAYRQDYFHNRLCVRQEKIWFGQETGEYRYSNSQKAVPHQGVLDFLRNAGSYRQVRTQKIDFLTFPEFDYSRTRLTDEKMGYSWDRIVFYHKDPEFFVVFDILKSSTEAYFTGCNLWHTRVIQNQGPHWYDTVYDSINASGLDDRTHLLILFPQIHAKKERVERQMRHYQPEWTISQTGSQHFEMGQNIGFITVLIPHAAQEDPSFWCSRVSSGKTEPEDAGLFVKIDIPGCSIAFGVKSDLRMDMIRDYRRPKYTYESGRVLYGDLETNGDAFYYSLKNNILDYTVVNLTQVKFKQKSLFQQTSGFFGLAFDGNPDQEGVGKIRYRQDTLDMMRFDGLKGKK